VRARVLVLIVSCLALAGCGGEKVVTPTAESVQGTLPQEQPVGKGEPAAGKTLFAQQGCNGCHTFKPAAATGKIGPDLDNLAADAKKANEGSVEQYTADSIKNPNGYVVPGFQQGVMPSYSQLSDEQVADLVAFLTQSS
jgi:cytochrome c oxidase subunit 2